MAYTISLFLLLSSILGCTAEKQGYTRNNATGSTVTTTPSTDDSTSEVDDTPATDNTVSTTTPAATTTKPLNYCGSTNIVGGTAATANDMVVKSTVRIMEPNEYCTGTIIGPNQIITAAHCFKGDTGTSTPPALSTIVIEFGVQPRAVTGIKVTGLAIHPDYKGLGLDKGQYIQGQLYDVAVITFSGTLPAGYGVAPVGSTTNLKSGTEVILAGYGAYSDNDRQVRQLTQVKTTVAQFDANYKELQLTVGGGKGGCYGDSGGPSYVMDSSGLCLNTLSTTTGPGRLNKSGLCTEGSATLMDITTYQGWLSCSYEKLGSPLAYLAKDESKSACDRTTAIK